jgi:hypothetical protein
MSWARRRSPRARATHDARQARATHAHRDHREPRAEEPRPEISVVLEDAAERTAVVEYDANGKLLRLHAE